jgi:hypothetical protein
VRAAFNWVRRLAAVLANKKGLDAAAVRRRYRGVIAALARHRGSLGSLAEALDHFRKVTRSYWPGLFRCYGIADLPRTNNDLEQFFGSYRYHERRCSGRKVACPGTVVRGSVRLVAAAATRLRPIEVADLVPSDLSAWRDLRGRLGQRQAVRTLGRRFRRDPAAYLRSLEDSLINQALPP